MKKKADLKEVPDSIIIIFGLCLLLTDLLSVGDGEEGSFEIGRPRSRDWRNFGCR